MVCLIDWMCILCLLCVFFFQAEDGIRDLVRSRGLGDVYKRQALHRLFCELEDLSFIPSISFYGTSDSIKISTSQDLCHCKFQELLDSGRESKMTRQEFHAFILNSRP